MSELTISKIQKYDRDLKETEGIKKSDRPNKETALKFLDEYAALVQDRDSVSFEKGYATALVDLPILGALGCGYSWEMATGQYPKE